MIKVILCYRDGYAKGLDRLGEKKYRAQFKKAVQELGNHKAVFGFHVGDEPDAETFKVYCRAMKIQKELAPNLTPFLNLLPWHSGGEQKVGFNKWSEYLDAYVTKANPELLCYDCYSQMKPGTTGWNMYFKNLREYREASIRHNIPLWNTISSVGSFNYRCPSEDDLRWQLNTSLAHGVQGILYFFLYLREPCQNYRLSPIDEHYERTETFGWLSRVNRTFLKMTAPVIQDLELKRVSHFKKSWGGVKKFDGKSGRVNEIVCETPLIISEFIHKNSNDEYVMVVNNSVTDNCQPSIKISRKNIKLYHIRWEQREDPMEPGRKNFAIIKKNSITIKPWLAPGQMELYKIEN